VIGVRTGGSYHSPTRGYVRSAYSAREIDAIVAYCADPAGCYYLPVEEVAGLGYVHLRLGPTRNAQRAGIRMARDYDLGAIAQLGERLTGSQEVGGSNPPGSTSYREPAHSVGSQEFHRRFGWYAQQVAAGSELLITRRGRPYVKVIPATPQLSLNGSAPDSSDPGGEDALARGS
jgi:prevent-host-death family protein